MSRRLSFGPGTCRPGTAEIYTLLDAVQRPDHENDRHGSAGFGVTREERSPGAFHEAQGTSSEVALLVVTESKTFAATVVQEGTPVYMNG